MSLSVHQTITSVKEQKIGRATRVLCYWSHLNRKWMQIVLFSTEDKNQMVSSWCFFVWVKLYKSISRLKREQFLNCSSWVWRCYRCQIGRLFFKTENKRVKPARCVLCPALHTWFCLLLSCHHVILPVFSVWQRLSKHCTSEVCSQHALCAYMWIILATEQCSSTWPVSWNIPLCDPSEASHPTVTLLLLPVRIPRNVPVVPQTKPPLLPTLLFLT